ncbi:MAG: chemotaxis protein CheW [Synergistaceae bacterium]|nr:chemotaxis protein CheW [Synergistaceae bacterium]
MGFFSKGEHEAVISADDERYMTFKVGGQLYGVPAAIVSEVTTLPDISTLPDPNGEIIGVMEHKGSAFVVLDLGMRFLLRPSERTEKSCVLIVGREGNAESGCLIDEAIDIIKIPHGHMEAKDLDGFYLYRLNDKNILLPDIEKFFINQF